MSENGGAWFYRGYRIIARFWNGAFQGSVMPYETSLTPKTPTNRVVGADINDVFSKAQSVVDDFIGYPRRRVRPNKSRVTHCHYCHETLSSYETDECADCGALICSCEACGCGHPDFAKA